MLTKIHHIGIVVRSLDEAYAFYRDALCLPVHKEAVIQDQGVRAALLTIGESEIELLEPIAPGTGVARFLEQRGEGLHHLCFETDDVSQELGNRQTARRDADRSAAARRAGGHDLLPAPQVQPRRADRVRPAVTARRQILHPAHIMLHLHSPHICAMAVANRPPQFVLATAIPTPETPTIHPMQHANPASEKV